MDSTHFEYTLSSCSYAPPTSTAKLTCVEVVRRRIRIGLNFISLPDQKLVPQTASFTPLYTPNFARLKPTPVGAIPTPWKPSSFSLNYAGISQIIYSLDGTYSDCSTISREIDDSIMSSASKGRGVTKVKILKVTTKVYNIDKDSEKLLINLYKSSTSAIQYPALFRHQKKKRSTECVICMEDYTDGSIVADLVCGHDFHGVCLNKCSKVQHVRCPLCRLPILQPLYSLLYLWTPDD